jgi:hypothetical protein
MRRGWAAAQQKKKINWEAGDVRNLFLKHLYGTTEHKYLKSRKEG